MLFMIALLVTAKIKNTLIYQQEIDLGVQPLIGQHTAVKKNAMSFSHVDICLGEKNEVQNSMQIIIFVHVHTFYLQKINTISIFAEK